MQFTRDTNRSRSRLADLTPMVDVVLQLIIFFMYTSAFTQFVRAPIDLPEERGEGGEATADLVLDIDGLGGWFVDGAAVTPTRFGEIARAEAASQGVAPSAFTVLIRADRDLSANHLNAAAASLNELGVRRWRLGAVRPALGPAGGGAP